MAITPEICKSCVHIEEDCVPNAVNTCSYYENVFSNTITKSENDNVNHPNHYTQGGIECIKAIEASMPPSGFQDYCKGNVLKYIWRYREKNGLEDLKKARVYLDWMIESVEKEVCK